MALAGRGETTFETFDICKNQTVLNIRLDVSIVVCIIIQCQNGKNYKYTDYTLHTGLRQRIQSLA